MSEHRYQMRLAIKRNFPRKTHYSFGPGFSILACILARPCVAGLNFLINARCCVTLLCMIHFVYQGKKSCGNEKKESSKGR